MVLTFFVRRIFGDETFICDGSECTLGSGPRWLLTGVAFFGPFLAVAGFRWSEMLERRGRLAPEAKWQIPDAEQILEIVTVILAGLLTYWLVLNGPSTELVEGGRLNGWANDVRNFRREEGTPETELVPSRLTWFIIGGLLSVPFLFSFGSMIGREWFGRRRRKGHSLDDEDDFDSTDDDEGEIFELGEG